MSTLQIEDIYPLSPMQQGMFFHSLYAPESGVYVEQVSYRIDGPLNLSAFEWAWQHVLEHHTILRTAFVWEELDEPLQVVHEDVILPVEQQDWRDLSAQEQERRLATFLEEDQRRGFDLDEAPLMRITMLHLAEGVYQCVWTHHHLLLDGWSLPMLLQEVFGIYEQVHQGTLPEPQPSRPFRDYIAWLQAQDMDAAERFWRQTLAGFTAPTPLTVDHMRIASEPDAVTEPGLMPLHFSEATTATLQAVARQHQVTINTLVQGAWALLLSRYSGEDDVVFGATVSGRPTDLSESELMIGLFINTLPVRVPVRFDIAVITWLKELYERQVEMRQYEYSPLVQIHEWSDVPSGLSLFESILVFENYPVDTEALNDEHISLHIEETSAFSRTNYPITLVANLGSTLMLEIVYDTQRFTVDTIERMCGHLHTIIEGFATNPQQRLADVPMLTEAERQQLLVAWNDTATDFPSDTCIHHLFEQQAEQTPDAIAVLFENQQVTYRDLNQRSNQLAHHLQARGVQPETLVGICAERSLDMAVAVLGVLKAGGAYVPLDPTYPTERLAFMLEDSGVPLLLTQTHLCDQLPTHAAQTICLDSEWETIARQPATNPTSGATPDNLVYVIYTSGSTGRPKGTLLQHRGLCNTIPALISAFDVQPDSRVIQFAAFGFDASVSELFMTWLAGATLVLTQRETLVSVPDLLTVLREQAITIITLPPSMLAVLPADDLPALRTVISAGESCSQDIVERWSPGRRFVNGYGPTEATIGATFYRATALPETMTRVPIGRPIANSQVYILDAHLHPVPIGVAGELHIGGVGLARGYLNRPDLTAEKFIANPFSDEPGTRLYKTGDLVCYLPDGNIEFLGRIDHQVKLRGFRIELGEIEAILRQHAAVQDAVVLVREDTPGNQRLVAYLVAPPDQPAPDTGDVRSHILAQLPEYMVPAAFVVLDAFPLTPNGKVDRKVLPAPDGAQTDSAASYTAPRNPTEEILAGIWSQTLGVSQVSIHASFYELGGHSLLATQIVSRIREAFQVELPLRNLFEAPTVAGLAQQISTIKQLAPAQSAPPLQPVPRETHLPVSFAQQRLWVLNQLDPDSAFHNIPTAVRLRGALDHALLEQSLNTIIQRHESLRTTFALADDYPVQVIAPHWTIPLQMIDLSTLPAAEREHEALRLATAEVQQPFNLAHGPLLRVLLMRMDAEEHIIVLTLHHIITDGWSNGVLVQELATLYNACVDTQSVELPPLPIQYADFAVWQRQWLQGSVLDALLDYWKQQLAGVPPLLELPTDWPRPAVQSFRGAVYGFTIPKNVSDAVNSLSQQEGVTLFMTLVATFQTLLYRYSGQEDICVGTPIANRTSMELEPIIGFFVNTLVLRGTFSDDLTFRDVLQQVREVTLDAYAYQDMPFEMLVDALQPERNLSHTPLFQVMFVLNNTPRGDLELPHLTISPVQVESQAAQFDITLEMAEAPEGLNGWIEYNTDLFDETTIQRLAGHFQTLLEGIVEDVEQPVAALPLLTDAEQQQLLVEWNDTSMALAYDQCLHHLFEQQVNQVPDAVALTFEETVLTYRELNARANQLAHTLQQLGVGPEVLVGVCTERSLEMIIGVLGILKAGGAYIPLDPTYPAERLAFMLTDSQTAILLTQRHLLDSLPSLMALTSNNGVSDQHSPTVQQVVYLDSEWDAIARQPDTNPTSSVTPDNLAYVIYTSGSTGQPKGAMLRHSGLCNLADVQRDAFEIAPGKCVLQFSPFSFDASVWETVMALRSGATLSLARQEVIASGNDLVRLLREQAITTATLPPSLLAVLPAEDLPTLTTIIAAGEKCTAELVARWASGRRFFNAYGPTETTVCASMYLCDADDPDDPPIGRPISNFQVYILDPQGQPVPVGVPGELHVGGVGLARGYLNRPELTAEKFIANSFSDEPGARLYRTGDLARYRPDGTIEFLGRIDHQVKVRGFRIELGEIEATLRQHAAVQDAVVLAREDVPGVQRLVAYLIAADGYQPLETASDAATEGVSPLSIAQLRSFLRETLPEYMVPVTFLFLEAWPLSPSGKVDRKALPAPDSTRPDLEAAYVAPRTPTEEALAAICSELLGLERVGIHDNFFELGGNSLLATQFITRIRDRMDVSLPLRDLFEHPNVASLAEQLERARAQGGTAQAPAITPRARGAHRMKRSMLGDQTHRNDGAEKEPGAHKS